MSALLGGLGLDREKDRQHWSRECEPEHLSDGLRFWWGNSIPMPYAQDLDLSFFLVLDRNPSLPLSPLSDPMLDSSCHGKVGIWQDGAGRGVSSWWVDITLYPS